MLNSYHHNCLFWVDWGELIFFPFEITPSLQSWSLYIMALYFEALHIVLLENEFSDYKLEQYV